MRDTIAEPAVSLLCPFLRNGIHCDRPAGHPGDHGNYMGTWPAKSKEPEMSTTTYSAWVSDSEGNRLYTTSGHATRQEALDQAWKRHPSARTVASGKGANGWEDVQFQTAVARRIETGAPEPTGEAWDGSEIEQSWEMTPEAAERNAKFAAFATAAADIDPALYGLPQDSEIGPEVYPEHRLNARRCGIHGESTSSGRCASCDREVARLEYGHEGQHDFTIPEIAGHAPEEAAPPAGWDVAEPGPEQRMGAWELTSVVLTDNAKRHGKAATYRYHVTGINHHEGGRTFSWTVPDLDNPEYDFSRVTVPELPEREARP